jgi:hypothetical protein
LAIAVAEGYERGVAIMPIACHNDGQTRISSSLAPLQNLGVNQQESRTCTEIGDVMVFLGGHLQQR